MPRPAGSQARLAVSGLSCNTRVHESVSAFLSGTLCAEPGPLPRRRQAVLRGLRSSAGNTGPHALRVTKARARPLEEDFHSFSRAASYPPLSELGATGPVSLCGADCGGLRQPGGRCAQAHTQGHPRVLESTRRACTPPASRGVADRPEGLHCSLPGQVPAASANAASNAPRTQLGAVSSAPGTEYTDALPTPLRQRGAVTEARKQASEVKGTRAGSARRVTLNKLYPLLRACLLICQTEMPPPPSAGLCEVVIPVKPLAGRFNTADTQHTLITIFIIRESELVRVHDF